MHLAFASSEGAVGYMDSRADGESCVVGVGSGPNLFYADMTDALYELLTGADAVRDVGFDCECRTARLLCLTWCVGERPMRSCLCAGAGAS